MNENGQTQLHPLDSVWPVETSLLARLNLYGLGSPPSLLTKSCDSGIKLSCYCSPRPLCCSRTKNGEWFLEPCLVKSRRCFAGQAYPTFEPFDTATATPLRFKGTHLNTRCLFLSACLSVQPSTVAHRLIWDSQRCTRRLVHSLGCGAFAYAPHPPTFSLRQPPPHCPFTTHHQSVAFSKSSISSSYFDPSSFTASIHSRSTMLQDKAIKY